MQNAIISLNGVSKTLLWTLHNRAWQAAKADSFFKDEAAISICNEIEFEFIRYFGKPDISHALRSAIFDKALKTWLKQYPTGEVIELGCGLETQFQRCDNGCVQWKCIDLPNVISFRQQLLPEQERCQYIGCSATDTNWFEHCNSEQPVFITAQGLFMYFYPSEVKNLLLALQRKFAHATVMFDTIPPGFSKKTIKGYWRTKHYRVPNMPWGISRRSIQTTLRHWLPFANTIEIVRYDGIPHKAAVCLNVLSKIPGVRNQLPYAVKIAW